jgi:hypothetical protein
MLKTTSRLGWNPALRMDITVGQIVPTDFLKSLKIYDFIQDLTDF